MRHNPVFKGHVQGFRGRDGHKVAKKATTYEQQGEEIVFRLYTTNIVTVKPHEIVLNTGGWNTVTTRRRMNEISQEFNLGFRVDSSTFRGSSTVIIPR